MDSYYYHGKLNMLGIYQHETIFNPALVDALLHVSGDVDESAPGGDFEPEFFPVTFHYFSSRLKYES